MKNTIIAAVLAAITFVSCRKKNDLIPVVPDPTATKTIQFALSQGADYSHERYDGLTATVNIHVARVSKKDGAVINLWDTAVTNQSIRDYPLVHQPFTFGKTFNGIKDQEENVSVSYWIIYKTKQNELHSEGKNEFAPAGNSNLHFPVRL